MLVQLVGLFVIEGLSLFGVSCFKLKNEYVIPITCMSMGVLLFLFGTAGFLRAGVYVLLALSAASVAISVWICARRGSWHETARNLFTPAAVLFVAAYLIAGFCCAGWLASTWDEFSHWADIVKVMSYINDFGTNPASNSMFQNYPPAMALFQYFFQVIYQLLSVPGSFSEWRLLFAYQVYVAALLVPFLSIGIAEDVSPVKCAITAVFRAVVILISLSLFDLSSIFHTIYIDSFVGIAAATAFVHSIAWQEKECSVYRDLVVFLTCFTLVLSKDVGLLFAIFAVILNAVTHIRVRRSAAPDGVKPRFDRRELCFWLLSAACIAVPEFLWKLNIQLDHATVMFSAPYDFGVLLSVLAGNDTSYRAQVFANYFSELIHGGIRIGDLSMSYTLVLTTLLACVFFMTLYVQKGLSKFKNVQKKPSYSYFTVITVLFFVYILGLAATYMFKFSEYEALRLASMSRYMGILVACLWLFLVLSYLCTATAIGCDAVHTVVFATLIFYCSSLSTLRSYFSTEYVYSSISSRLTYDSVTQDIRNAIGDRDANIYFIIQGGNGSQNYVMKYELRPYQTVNMSGWSVGEEPFYDGDVWTQIIAPEDWEASVLDGYDYVYLFYVNDYFRETYSGFFCGDIEEQALYAVDKSAGVCRIIDHD